MISFLNKKSKTFNLLAIIIIILAGVAAYMNSFHCAFQFDDYPNITENLRIRNLRDFYSWWSFNPRRPIGIMTFVLNYHFNGLNVWGYHLVNLSIHLTNGFLIYWLIKQTFQTPAFKDKYDIKMQLMISFFAALLFVVHPLMTEAVTYIVQRLVSLATLFYLLSMNLYINGRLNDNKKSKQILIFSLSFLAAIAGLLTKEISYTIVFAILLYEVYFFNTSIKIWKSKWFYVILLFFIASISLFLLTVRYGIFFKVLQPTEGNNYSITTYTYLLTEFRVILTYIRLLFVPIKQVFDYDYPLSTTFFELKTALSFLTILALLAIAIWIRKKNKWISFGILWFFLTISVQSSIIARPNVIFEHRVYLSAIGYLFFLIGIFIYFDKFKDVRSIMLAVAITMSAVFGVLTYQRNKVWLNTYTFWTDCVKNSPNKPRALNNYGQVLILYGDYENGMRFLNKSIEITPNDPVLLNSRGYARYFLKDTIGAIADYKKAISLNPKYALVYYNLANIDADRGNFVNAIEFYDKAILNNPKYTKALRKRDSVNTLLLNK